MKNAKEARVATHKQLAAIAKDWIEHFIPECIQAAIENGEYNAICILEDIPNAARVGANIVDILEKEYGYCAKFVQAIPDACRYEPPYITISWEKE